jgi:predicted transposase/invertase (TIGR01784 family)
MLESGAPRYIDLKLDIAFKALFGSMKHKHILKHFLNSVLPEGIVVADILSIKNPKPSKNSKIERGVEYDVYCTDQEGKHFIVEMQNQTQSNFIERMLFYVSKAVVNQAKKGKEWKFDVLPVHFVGVLNFYLDNSALAEEVVQHIQLKNQDNKLVTNTLSYTLIQLPLFEKDIPEAETDRDRWLYLLNHIEKLKKIPQNLKSSIFEEVFEISQHFNMNPRTRELWEEGIKRQRDFLNQLDYARQEGKLEGELRGKLEGEQRGKLEGKREGERVARIAIAKNLKTDGKFSTEMIATITGITIQEILNL